MWATATTKFKSIAGIIIIAVLANLDGSKRFYKATDNYFNRRYLKIKMGDMSYDLDAEESGRSLEETEISEESNQRLQSGNVRLYEKEDVVRCLDSLSIKRNRRPMHIAFVGDSTVRQHFSSFIRWIPDYDRKTLSISTTFAEYAFHEDMNVTSHLLDNLRVSFYWRNLIRSDLIDDFRRWASTSDDTHQAPDFILIGVTAHHLIVENGVSNSLKMYEKLLEDELVPLLKQSLTVHPHQEIIWLRQSLTIEQLTPADENHVAYGIYPDKIQKYNAILPRILKGTKVLLWDTINAVVEEYIRACSLMKYDRRDKLDFQNCNDLIHPGYGALSLGTHLFINHICNSENI